VTKRWLVTCSCGWGRECVSEWAAQSVSKLHPQLGQMDVPHVTRVEGWTAAYVDLERYTSEHPGAG
jgi:hypothetical protein